MLSGTAFKLVVSCNLFWTPVIWHQTCFMLLYHLIDVLFPVQCFVIHIQRLCYKITRPCKKAISYMHVESVPIVGNMKCVSCMGACHNSHTQFLCAFKSAGPAPTILHELLYETTCTEKNPFGVPLGRCVLLSRNPSRTISRPQHYQWWI